MATFQDRLKFLRKEKNITLDKLAEALNTTKATLSRYENGLRIPNVDFANQLSEFFGVQSNYILGKSDFKEELPKGGYIPNEIKRLPILGVVRAGEPLYAEQNIIGYFSIDAKLVPSGDYFYLKVIGDSMNLSHILDGQLILIRRQEEVENGEMALVLVHGEDATIKKFYRTDNMVTLMPHSSNPEYQPRVIDLKQVSVKVIGKVSGTFISL